MYNTSYKVFLSKYIKIQLKLLKYSFKNHAEAVCNVLREFLNLAKLLTSRTIKG